MKRVGQTRIGPEDRGTAWAVLLLCAGLGLAGWLAVTLWAGRLPVLGLLLLLGCAVLLAWRAGQRLQQHRVHVARLLEQAQVLTTTGAPVQLALQGSADLRGLATAFNKLAEQRRSLQAQMATQVAQASQRIEHERSRLAALMGELAQPVVVCNLEGRVLLYNQRAKQQLAALYGTTAGVAPLGLGRSVHSLIEPGLLDHALAQCCRALAQGHSQPMAQFVCTVPGGLAAAGADAEKLLRVQMVPVRDAGDALLAEGFVLMLEDISRQIEQARAQAQRLQELTALSHSLNARPADPALPAQLARWVQQAQGIGDKGTRWPLQAMAASDVVQAALRQVTASGRLRAAAEAVDPGLWVQVDSYALVQALAHLAGRLADDFGVRSVQLRFTSGLADDSHGHDDRHGWARLDLAWPALAISSETVMGWEQEPLAQPVAGAVSVRQVVQLHGGAFGFERDQPRQQQYFSFSLPVAAAADARDETAHLKPGDSRPESYDFDLFGHSESQRAMDDRPLAELRYTVFDTETTGLAPRQGDEIIQIGAVRIVGNRLLRDDCFDQLVNPQRSVPAAGQAIHGISAESLQNQPTIGRVLPAFHAFAADSVLVAHNAAFDMRFLQLKEAATGLHFDQPVLDTLLLSACVHPQQESHRLEAIAHRFGVQVQGRHTGLGDALVTAEVFLHLLPLLAERGIHTLGQAREASRKTQFSRLAY